MSRRRQGAKARATQWPLSCGHIFLSFIAPKVGDLIYCGQCDTYVNRVRTP